MSRFRQQPEGTMFAPFEVIASARRVRPLLLAGERRLLTDGEVPRQTARAVPINTCLPA